MGIYFHTTLKSTQIFFFSPLSPHSQRDAKTEWDEGRERCGSEGATLSCREASPEDTKMTSRAMNVAPNQPVVNTDIRPRCLMLAAPFGRPWPPRAAGKPQGGLEESHLGALSLQKGHGRNPSDGIWGGKSPQKGQGGTWESEGFLQFGVAPSRCVSLGLKSLPAIPLEHIPPPFP